LTPHKVTATTANSWADEVRKAYGLELHVMSREDIITSLILPTNAALCGTLPGITVPVEKNDADLLARSAWLSPRKARRGVYEPSCLDSFGH
jgi:hypothetical protein